MSSFFAVLNATNRWFHPNPKLAAYMFIARLARGRTYSMEINEGTYKVTIDGLEPITFIPGEEWGPA